MGDYNEMMTDAEREVEEATEKGKLLPARSLAGDLGAGGSQERYIEIALGQYQLALERGATRWIDDFRRASKLYLPENIIERRFPPAPTGRDRNIPIFVLSKSPVTDGARSLLSSTSLTTSGNKPENIIEHRFPPASTGRDMNLPIFSLSDSPVTELARSLVSSKSPTTSENSIFMDLREKLNAKESALVVEMDRERDTSERKKPGHDHSHATASAANKRVSIEADRDGAAKRVRYGCPVADCRLGDTSAREHVIRRHIPVLLGRMAQRQRDGVRVHRKRAQFIREVAWNITGQSDPQLLLKWVNERFGMPIDATIGPALWRDMEDICDTMGWCIPSGGFKIYPMNSPAVLMHWRAIAYLMSCLTEELRIQLCDKYERLPKQRPSQILRYQRYASATEKTRDNKSKASTCTSGEPNSDIPAPATSSALVLPPPIFPERRLALPDDVPVSRPPIITLRTAEGKHIPTSSMIEFKNRKTTETLVLNLGTPPKIQGLELMDVSELNDLDMDLRSPILDYTGTPSSRQSDTILSLTPSPTKSEEGRLLTKDQGSATPEAMPPTSQVPLDSLAPGVSSPVVMVVEPSGVEPTEGPRTFAEMAKANIPENRFATLKRISKPQTPVEKDTFRMEAYDSHFHLDRLASRCNKGWEQMLKALNEPTDVPVENPVMLVSGTMVFCDPVHYHRLPFAAVGVHPRHAVHFTAGQRKKLEKLVKSRHFVAFGEVWLDFSCHPDTWVRQEEVLESVLGLSHINMILVLHVRGANKDRHLEQVSARCLDIVRRYCPEDQLIHLHCFSGGTQQLQEWRRAFSNCYFGFTGKVKSFSVRQKEALRRVPANRLLIETDSPYMPMLPGLSITSPAYIGEVARQVSEVDKVQKTGGNVVNGGVGPDGVFSPVSQTVYIWEVMLLTSEDIPESAV